MDKKELFLQELGRRWNGNKKMIDYCAKESAYIVELDDGDIMSIPKPRIETSFCFGYGYCGVTTSEEMKSASASAQNARTNADYFKRENLKDIDEWLEALRGDDVIYKLVNYYGVPADFKLKQVYVLSRWRGMPENAEVLSAREREAIIAGYEEVRAKFVKRLDTYLKRYGTSKVHSWTYLVD